MQEEADKFSSFIETLSASPNHYHRAMITYLDYPECWKGAARFYHADTLTHWRKRKQMGHNIAAFDEASTKQLADLIRNKALNLTFPRSPVEFHKFGKQSYQIV